MNRKIVEILTVLSATLFSFTGLSHGQGEAHQIDPYHVGTLAPKLTTPQWVGDAEVEAVVILSIDDMRETDKYEEFLRPILDRLKRIDGRAPVSIFTNSIDPADPQLQSWLEEGLSLEVHTVDHPCPLLKDGDFAKAKSTYDRCVDMMASIGDSYPVAFRMPCCDSLNTPSPRFWKEIFEKRTANGNYLAIDSSVFNIFTSDDNELSLATSTNDKGGSRFRHYVPFKSFVNTIENYPYPYIIGESCWEFPCVVPSDWEAQNVQQPNNPVTVRDLKIALDATVAKRGVMPIVFHPHGWIRNDQLVEFVDYAVDKYGKRVKFLNFAEALKRINKNLLGGVALRTSNGNEHNIRLVDVNGDGFLDVMRQSHQGMMTRVWNQGRGSFDVSGKDDVRFEDPIFLTVEGEIGFLATDVSSGRTVHYQRREDEWEPVLLVFKGKGGSTIELSRNLMQAEDVDADGTDELLVAAGKTTMVFKHQSLQYALEPYTLPAKIAGANGYDTGVRLVDLNGDDRLDVVKSDGETWAVWLFENHEEGWKQVRGGAATDADAIPVIANQDGTNNGAWFHSEHLWVQNENTARLPDLVDRASFTQLTEGKQAESNENDDEHPLGTAKSVEESLATFQVIEGARLEVVAAEPQVQDPVAFDWGPDGKLWVVEMGDYPNGANWHGPGDNKGDNGGRVKILEDKDNDGRFETSHLFLDGLNSPTGVKAWRGGVLVSCAPDVVYAEDTDGDHKADVREVLYTGMREGNQQHRANGLRWGLDHWLHMANGDSGGVVRSTKTGESLDTRGRDLRIRPDDGGMQLTSGPTQFGRSRDRFGNWFGGNNSNPVWHYVLDERYMRRNPHFSPPSARRQIAEVPGAAPVFPTSKTVERFNDFDRANRFTSACSPEIYSDDWEDEDGNRHEAVYICEPVHNLVHRSRLRRNGPTFTASRFAGEEQTEFLTSSDNWFRPVMVRAGPEGDLWIADMYRMVIEHPEWIPKQWQDRIDHLAGNDKGRIYRVRLQQRGDDADTDWKKIRSQSIAQLVDTLSHHNGILRDMAQQELYERNDKAAIPLLKKALTEAPIQASNLLEHFDALETPVLAQMEKDALPSVLRLVEPTLRESVQLRDEVLGMAEKKGWNDDPALAMQMAYTLGAVDDSRAGIGLARIALASLDDETDKYVRAAVMSSVTQQNVSTVMSHFRKGLADVSAESKPVARDFLIDIVESAVGYGDGGSIEALVKDDAGNKDFSVIGALLAAANRRDESLDELLGLAGVASVQSTAQRAQSVANDESQSIADRVEAIRMFGYLPELRNAEREVLLELLSPAEPQQLQRSAIELLAADEEVDAAKVLSAWSSFTPVMRDATLNATLRNENWIRALLDRIESEEILPVQVALRHRHELLQHKSDAIRERASKLFSRVDSNRESVVRKYASHALADADLDKGRAVFKKQCSACHQLEGQGNNIGPDLTAISDKSMPAMLTAILDPNRAVEEKYLDYSVLTGDGQLHRGILLDESATSVTLATPEGKTMPILRNEIEELQATGRSLMPEGLETVLSPQDVADVVGYVQSISVPRKRFAGNTPQVAPVRDDGSIRLFAMHAEIYGPKVVLEEKYRNLGFWSDSSDRAVWTIDAVKAGRYELHLDYACSPQTRKNRFQIRVNGQTLGGSVDFTSSWDDYRSHKVGMVELPDEPVTLSIQSDGPVNGFVMDLRTILLYPDD